MRNEELLSTQSNPPRSEYCFKCTNLYSSVSSVVHPYFAFFYIFPVKITTWEPVLWRFDG